jgi:hypothetical protein
MPLTKAEAARMLEGFRSVLARFTDGETAECEPDPIVRTLPNKWKGEDYRGRPFSATDSRFLGELARALDWRADLRAVGGQAPPRSCGPCAGGEGAGVAVEAHGGREVVLDPLVMRVVNV